MDIHTHTNKHTCIEREDNEVAKKEGIFEDVHNQVIIHPCPSSLHSAMPNNSYLRALSSDSHNARPT